AIHVLHGSTSSVFCCQIHSVNCCAGHSSCRCDNLRACLLVRSQLLFGESRSCRYYLIVRPPCVTGQALKPLPLPHTYLHPPSPSRVSIPLHTTTARPRVYNGETRILLSFVKKPSKTASGVYGRQGTDVHRARPPPPLRENR
ncbi:unnamed protein product, partial [Ectocarpus sp. 12 AP-2014]